MNQIERIKMVKAMEFIVRRMNNEELFDPWLTLGVADGDISEGDLAIQSDDLEDLEYYIDDETFAELMGLFLSMMSDAYEDGGLYCDNVVSNDE